VGDAGIKSGLISDLISGVAVRSRDAGPSRAFFLPRAERLFDHPFKIYLRGQQEAARGYGVRLPQELIERIDRRCSILLRRRGIGERSYRQILVTEGVRRQLELAI
jgi:hypothetical protein